MMRSIFWIAASLCVLGAACQSDRRAGSGADAGSSHVSDGAVTADAGTSGETSCSADLQNVTDAQGNVLQTCPPNQGCYAGYCVAACDAAAMSKGNVGCDFTVATPAFLAQIAPPCFAVFLANNWSSAIHITVSRAGVSYDATQFARIATGISPTASTWPSVPISGLPPGQVAVLFLSGDPNSSNGGHSLACPVPTAVAAGTAVAGTAKGTAFHIQTDAPVSAYDVLPYGGALSYLPSAELLLPNSAWGTNYVFAVPPKGSGIGDSRWGQVVASQDNTTVMINPTETLLGAGGVPSAPKGQVTSFILNAGEFVQWADAGEISGSVLSSDKPVVVGGGSGSLCLGTNTSNGGGCDSAHQVIPPVSALGSEYVGAPYVTRRASLQPESIPYRFVGAVDGTLLLYDPAIAGAPTTLNRGVVADFETTTPFTVTSQDASHPFYVAQLMGGGSLVDGSRPGITPGSGFADVALGDEEFVNLLPPAQFLSKYVFFTDPTYGTTNLVLTRAKHAAGFKDVTIDCVGKVTGWSPIGTKGIYEYAQLGLVRAAVGVGTCTNGPHIAQSDGSFGLMVWGTDLFASYAYPGGGNVGTISTAVVIP